MAPKLNWDDLTQTAALPLGSWLKTDPWDDKIHMLNAKRYAPMNPRDKMPLEVTPIFYRLQRYEAANVEAPPAPPTAAPPASQPAATDPQSPVQTQTPPAAGDASQQPAPQAAPTQ
jgi:hypothetical protein